MISLWVYLTVGALAPRRNHKVTTVIDGQEYAYECEEYKPSVKLVPLPLEMTSKATPEDLVISLYSHMAALDVKGFKAHWYKYAEYMEKFGGGSPSDETYKAGWPKMMGLEEFLKYRIQYKELTVLVTECKDDEEGRVIRGIYPTRRVGTEFLCTNEMAGDELLSQLADPR